MPFLKSVRTVPERILPNTYPFTIPVLSQGLSIDFESNVTFFVGENGSGKSTILEAIAENCGFNPAGGSRNHTYKRYETESQLSAALKLAWFPKVTTGFFLRAESFFNFATYIDEIALQDPVVLDYYGGKSLHKQSHGESFLSLFVNCFKKGIYIIDEPEAALSPQRQLSFLSIVHELETKYQSQFLIATHSPIILCYPGAVVLSLDNDRIEKVDYQQTDHYRITKHILQNPEHYFHYLFNDL